MIAPAAVGVLVRVAVSAALTGVGHQGARVRVLREDACPARVCDAVLLAAAVGAAVVLEAALDARHVPGAAPACAQHLSAHSASLTPVSHVRSYPLMCAPSKQLKLRSPHALESWIGPYAASRRLVALRASAGGESRDLDHTSRCLMLVALRALGSPPVTEARSRGACLISQGRKGACLTTAPR